MHVHEALSALMDGEIMTCDLDNILLSIEHNQMLLSKWYRYHLVRAVLRKENITFRSFMRPKIISIPEEDQVQ